MMIFSNLIDGRWSFPVHPVFCSLHYIGSLWHGIPISVFFTGKNIHSFVKEATKRNQGEYQKTTFSLNSLLAAPYMQGSFWGAHSCHAFSWQSALVLLSTKSITIFFFQLFCKILSSNISFCFGASVHMSLVHLTALSPVHV